MKLVVFSLSQINSNYFYFILFMNSKHNPPKVITDNMAFSVDAIDSPSPFDIPYEDGNNAADKNLTPG